MQKLPPLVLALLLCAPTAIRATTFDCKGALGALPSRIEPSSHTPSPRERSRIDALVEMLEGLGGRFAPTDIPPRFVWSEELGMELGTYGIGACSVVEAPPPGRNSPTELALRHPLFAELLARLQRLGIHVVVDPSMTAEGSCAMVGPTISIRPDASWRTFLHEYHHALVARFFGRMFLERAVRGLPPPTPAELRARLLASEAELRALGFEVDTALRALEEGYGFRAWDELLSTTHEIRALRQAPSSWSRDLAIVRAELYGLVWRLHELAPGTAPYREARWRQRMLQLRAVQLRIGRALFELY